MSRSTFAGMVLLTAAVLLIPGCPCSQKSDSPAPPTTVEQQVVIPADAVDWTDCRGYQPVFWSARKLVQTQPSSDDKYRSFVLKIYKDSDDNWRWSMDTTSGKTIAMSHQYKTKKGAIDGFTSLEQVLGYGTWRLQFMD